MWRTYVCFFFHPVCVILCEVSAIRETIVRVRSLDCHTTSLVLTSFCGKCTHSHVLHCVTTTILYMLSNPAARLFHYSENISSPELYIATGKVGRDDKLSNMVYNIFHAPFVSGAPHVRAWTIRRRGIRVSQTKNKFAVCTNQLYENGVHLLLCAHSENPVGSMAVMGRLHVLRWLCIT